MVQATNEALVEYYGTTEWFAIQWHGMAQSTCPMTDVYPSHGRDAATAPTDKIELLRQKRPQMDEAEREAWANEFFQMQAIKGGDAHTFLAFSTARFKAEIEKEKLKIQQRDLQLKERKFVTLVLKVIEDQRAHEVARSNASDAEKIDQLGQLMFGEDWKAEA